MFLTKARPRTEPVTTVASRHIPFVETLWLRLRDAKTDVAAKEDYLRQVGNLGVHVESLTTVADAAVADAKAVRKAEVDLERIKRVLSFGCEPTTPPEWYCGHLAEPAKDSRGDYADETWPQAGSYYSRDRTRVYRGPIPATALQRYAAVAPLIDDARIYSPREDDFRQLRNPEPIDPVIIGMIRFLGEPQYVEIARWDIDRDLASIFGRVEK
jgi:hypothetical protein